MGQRHAATPRLREEGLVVQELPEEVLVYDLARHKAHCLSPLAAAIGGLSVLSLSAPTAALAISCLPAGSCVDKNCFNGAQRCCAGCRQTGNLCGGGQGFTYVCQ